MATMRAAAEGVERSGQIWSLLWRTSRQLLVMNWLWADREKASFQQPCLSWISQTHFLEWGSDSLSRVFPTELSHTPRARTWLGHSTQSNRDSEAWGWEFWAHSMLEVKATWGCPFSSGCGQGQFSIEGSGSSPLERNELSLLASLVSNSRVSSSAWFYRLGCDSCNGYTTKSTVHSDVTVWIRLEPKPSASLCSLSSLHSHIHLVFTTQITKPPSERFCSWCWHRENTQDKAVVFSVALGHPTRVQTKDLINCVLLGQSLHY